ncbi:sodium:proton antiporter [Chelatococcus reniformis]|uniref:Sodium:proton antiporter n=1 Tax=Chelatococcus reniformis TaxID=1494448 RepID=A0A916UXW6_9HYPH|nr:sodium:proton antiporter [Chelatococcus reniformis]GGC93096.1 sodium:proton antiporter [Chelatococcus reniformis]
MRMSAGAAIAIVLTALPGRALAAEGLDGAALGIGWILPFAGILASIALGPLVAHHAWERHLGKVSAFWALLAVAPLAALHGPHVTARVLAHAALLEYVPFILLLFGLFTTAGGLLIVGNPHGSTRVNVGLLALGTVLASLVGTTGASMILIRPLLRANDDRRHRAHVVIFFIFLVSNIGGSLTPLGDPPLFLGFLRGVDFFWTASHLKLETLFLVTALLVLFAALDRHLYRIDDTRPPLPDPTPDSRLRLVGLANIPLLAGIIGAILLSGLWKPGIAFTVLGSELKLENLARDGLLVVFGLLSLWLTPAEHRARNGFSWAPLSEVAKLFAGIFACIIPVVAILQAGPDGILAPLVALVTGPDGEPRNVAYFWLTGALSSVLDNAPTYLVFFELAGGDAAALMTTGAGTLAAISMGSVFMGALSYVGNAPNFMVYAIARERGVPMPSFFGYIVWSCGILIPLFLALTVIFIR